MSKRNTGVEKPAVETPVVSELRGVLITIAGGRLLLPNASMAEIISLSDPERVPQAPGWLLGRVRWQIGRASWRERVCQYVEISVGAVSLKKKKYTKTKTT